MSKQTSVPKNRHSFHSDSGSKSPCLLGCMDQSELVYLLCYHMTGCWRMTSSLCFCWAILALLFTYSISNVLWCNIYCIKISLFYSLKIILMDIKLGSCSDNIHICVPCFLQLHLLLLLVSFVKSHQEDWVSLGNQSLILAVLWVTWTIVWLPSEKVKG